MALPCLIRVVRMMTLKSERHLAPAVMRATDCMGEGPGAGALLSA